MICIRKRLKISSVIDTGAPLPDDLSRHLETCASCRDFYARQRAVAGMLERPVSDEEPYPDGLNASIMRAIDRPDAPAGNSAPGRRQFSPWLPPLAFASLALLAAIYLSIRPADREKPVLASNEPAAIEEVVIQETAPSDYIRSWSIAINQPLDNELESVVADARSAVQFLAFNFLPEKTEPMEQL